MTFLYSVTGFERGWELGERGDKAVSRSVTGLREKSADKVRDSAGDRPRRGPQDAPGRRGRRENRDDQ